MGDSEGRNAAAVDSAATDAREREVIVRGLFRMRAKTPIAAVRTASPNGMPVLEGYGAVFNEWTEIASFWEGNFMERIAPGAFSKTLQENASMIRSLFQHGRDPIVGDKPLGPFETLEEDDTGLHYGVPMLDTQYNAEIIPGLRAGLYGASFMFETVKDEMDQEPDVSAANPKGLPERTLLELRLYELGPVTFPAYAGATAGLRFMRDHLRGRSNAPTLESAMHMLRARGNVSLTDIVRYAELRDAALMHGLVSNTTEQGPDPDDTPSTTTPALDEGAGDDHSSRTSRTTVPLPQSMSQDDFLRSLEEQRWVR